MPEARARVACVAFAVTLPVGKAVQMAWFEGWDVARQAVLVAAGAVAVVVAGVRPVAGALVGWHVGGRTAPPLAAWTADGRPARLLLGAAAPLLCAAAVVADLHGWRAGTVGLSLAALAPLAGLAVWEHRRARSRPAPAARAAGTAAVAPGVGSERPDAAGESGIAAVGGGGWSAGAPAAGEGGGAARPDRAVLWSVAPGTLWWVAVVGVAALRHQPFDGTLGDMEVPFVSGAGGRALGTALVIGFGEEYLFRGLLLVLAVGAGVTRWGVAVVGASFAAWHVPDAADGGLLAVAGTVVAMFLVSQLVFTPLRLRGRSLAGPALLHAANNVALRLV